MVYFWWVCLVVGILGTAVWIHSFVADVVVSLLRKKHVDFFEAFTCMVMLFFCIAGTLSSALLVFGTAK
jgi:hypothetical protein